MGLTKYRSKRNLKKSHEPLAIKQEGSDALSFCIQKHAARHLHYDFRLEHRGVLVSWAVPKGPSLNPKEKRLAIKVEDHPLEYQYFEGVIPKGNYGAGTVEIWDHGSYTIPNTTSKAEAEKEIAKGLKQGHLLIVLNGKKLKGSFVLQKLKKDPEDQAWLLIKKEEKSNVDPAPSKRTRVKRTKMPDFIPPMLATLVQKPFSGEDWLFEIKWDGYRALAFIDHGEVQLKSRSNHSWNQRFSSVVADLEKLKGQAIFDGELVVVDAEGKPSFQLMQNYQKDGVGDLCYYVFDLLFKDGQDLRELPLIERKTLLKDYLDRLSLPHIRLSDHILKDGESFFKEIAKKNLEGIVGKKIDSTYQSKRSQDWVKVKTHWRQEVVIGGFTAPRGSRQKFGALLVGVYENNELKYVGHIGGGFDASLLDEIYKKLKPLIQKKSPFKSPPKANAPVTWVKPLLVCEASFAEWTKENMMRQPIFHGLRVDKDPKTIKKETPEPLPAHKSKRSKKEEPALTHLDKIYWPEEKYTKGDLITYYQEVAPFILPYLKNRPIMLHRYPNGIEGTSFYQKDLSAHPDWIKTIPIQHEGKIDHYLLINDLQSLLYAINLGSIDLHPFISTYQKLNNPDFCVLDLDPHKIHFDKVIEVALAFHHILEEIGVRHYCKTSGGKGLHILIPLHGKYDYEQSRQFAEIISMFIHKKLPHITSLERSPKKREGKVYLDCLQNRIGQTIVAPYSVRPRPKALVSTPLSWDEVNQKLDPSKFNLKTLSGRLKKKGDLLKDLRGSGANLKKALAHLETLLHDSPQSH